ncbi:VWA domain-containing protein [Occallatibacter savannae]|uniref:VWA domain-containing protein n=1 Tax=Occallatibacter savannae TaxID=1002691 RepID=UPI000D68EB9A|nr:VWA domain-containing protein [Occallatibacter savannae]
MTPKRHLPRLAVPALLFASASVLLAAQQSPSGNANPAPAAQSADKPAHTLRTPGHEVQLAVTVRDKKGALVPTIDKNDFTLTEDGRPQVIQTLTRQSTEPWRLGLLVETARPVGSALEEVRKAATQFVDAMLPAQASAGSANQLFLIHFDRQVELSEDFTASRDKLHQELDDLSATRERHDDTEGPETTGEDRDRPTRTRNASQLYDAIFLACDELMKNQQGRKAIVVFSDGIDRGSKDTLNDAVDAADRANVAVYTVHMRGQQEEENNGFSRNRRGGIGFPGGGGGGYPGGGGGYPSGGGQRREPKPIVDGKKLMEEIARRTGGHGYEAKKRDDVVPIYKLISEELQGQYVLTYTPDKADTDGGFHKVVVKAEKGDLQVTTREGYYAPGGDSR